MQIRFEKKLDLTVLMGLICHPTKPKPPAQIHKCSGFLYDSVVTPKLRIPDNKVVRALALVEFLMRGSRKVLCRLALAVVVGTLLSLAKCHWGIFTTPCLLNIHE
jgi:hypothetical protein